MRLIVILEQDGRVAAAMRESVGEPVNVAIRPSALQHEHRIDIPSELEKLSLGQLVERLQLNG